MVVGQTDTFLQTDTRTDRWTHRSTYRGGAYLKIQGKRVSIKFSQFINSIYNLYANYLIGFWFITDFFVNSLDQAIIRKHIRPDKIFSVIQKEYIFYFISKLILQTMCKFLVTTA